MAASDDKRRKRGKRRTKKQPETTGRSWWRIALYLLSGLALIGVLAVIGVYLYFAHGLPTFQTLADYQPPQMSRVYAQDGTVIGELFSERRTLVGHDEIPQVLIDAVLSAEDADFYAHKGLDYVGMLRAVYNGLKAGRVKGSGSTITQQTVKNLLLSSEKTLRRKVREIILARRLETQLSKNDILTIYLNAIYLGHGRYGVQEASRFYFGRDVSQMNLNQAATLAGLIQAPNGHSPRRRMKRALNRRSYVLNQMVKNKKISRAQADAVTKRPIDLGPAPKKPDAHYNWFLDIVRRRLMTRFGDDFVLRGGLSIYTPMDPVRQRAAVNALRKGLTDLDKRRGYGRKLRRVNAAGAKGWKAKRVKKLGGRPPGMGATVLARVTQVRKKHYLLDLGVGSARLSRRSAERLFVAHKKSLEIGDIVTVQIRSDGPRHPKTVNAVLAGQPQGAFLVLSNQGRDVLAMAGGWDYRDSPFNRATQAKRQPGSAIKPFIYGAAMERRLYSPSSIKVDAPVSKRVSRGKYWRPKNHSGKFLGPISLRKALAKSVNTIPAEMTDELGVQSVQKFSERAGITSPMAPGLASSLGASEVTPLELVNAYATIVSDGKGIAPRFVTRIVKPDGEIIAPTVDTAPAGVAPDTAYLIRSMLRSVVTDGTARRLKSLPRPVVGKTGTSQGSRDNWFVGAIPEVSFLAWVGFDNSRSIKKKKGKKRENSVTIAVPIAKTYLEKVERDGHDWPEPPEGVESKRIVIHDGVPMLACADQEDGFDEFFLTGSAPRECAPAADELDAHDMFFDGQGDDAAGDLPSSGLNLMPAKPSSGQTAPSLLPVRANKLLPVRSKTGQVDVTPPTESRTTADEDLPPSARQ